MNVKKLLSIIKVSSGYNSAVCHDIEFEDMLFYQIIILMCFKILLGLISFYTFVLMDILRKLLLPVVPIYFIVTWLRNKLYDWGIKKSKSYNFPVVAVGNLSVGGTGKSPMIEYLIRLLKNEVALATLSRGYKRETKGFYRVLTSSTAKQVGDEPLQFKSKFNDIDVIVDEDRQNGIEQLLHSTPKPEVILLDDAYQHRKVNASFYILLTAYQDLYSDDIVLPTGNLREPKKGADRAHIIVVTKCPKNISDAERVEIAYRLKINSNQKLYFSYIDYEQCVKNSRTTRSIDTLLNDKFTLVTGIANPKPLLDYYTELGLQFDHKRFPDHHNFTKEQLASLKKERLIVTTEKDYMRLAGFLEESDIWYQPIVMKFVENQESFDKHILKAIKNEIQ